jgi:transposase-like protein
MVELPPLDVKRWTFRRKAAVVTAVANGELTREEACRRYQLTEEEFLSWQRAFEAHGLPGLRSTRLQQYRGPGWRGR